MGDNKQLNMLDVMSMISFFLGIANYSENIGQSDMQEVITKFIQDMHNHLQEQDKKLDHIIELLERGEHIEA